MIFEDNIFNSILFLSSVLISFLGLPIGIILASFAPDEVHFLKKSLIPLQLILLGLLFLLFFWFFPFFIGSVFLLLSFAFIYLFWHRLDHNVLDYIVLSFLLVLLSLQTQVLLFATILIFLFGLVTGFLFYVLHTKDPTKTSIIKYSSVRHHKHSLEHLSLFNIFKRILKKYNFYLYLSVITFIVANICCFFFL